MALLKVEGGRRLEGRLSVEGNKNSALPLIAACLLTDEPCVIENVPRIRDVGVLLELLVGLGAEVEGARNSYAADPLSGRELGPPGPCTRGQIAWIGSAARSAAREARIRAAGAAGR